MRPLVSILIPTYKRAVYLREAIRSAQAQTHDNLEIIVLDDASPDETPQVVTEFADDPRVRSVRHPKNLGIVGNWRAGIEVATGEFFCLLHDDDTFEPTFVEALVAPVLADDDLILAFCDHWVMGADGIRLPSQSDASSRKYRRDSLPSGRLADFARTALIDDAVPVGASLFRRRLIHPGMISDHAKGAIDAWLFYQCARTGCQASYRAERLMNYRLHDGGMSSSNTIYMAEGHLARYQAMLSDPELAGLHPALRRKMGTFLTGYGIDLLAQGEARRARRMLHEALRRRGSMRGILALGLAYGGPFGTRVTAKLRTSP